MTASAASPKAFVIGHPVKHSRSPLIHGYWLERLGLAGAYEALEVRPGDVGAFLRGAARTHVGGNVTIPHKEAAFRAMDEVSDTAARLGAVNTVTVLPDGRLHGHNTDAEGFAAGLDWACGADWAEGVARALVLGSGGAARAVVAALLDRGVGRVIVAARTAERAEALAEIAPARIETVPFGEIGRHLEAADLLVNTTSLGMAGEEPLAIEIDALPANAIVTDIVYVPLETPLLAAASVRGLRVADGLNMLLHQAVPGFERWFGQRPTVTPELKARIVADLARG